ncbi:MAG TPA: cardiolipin synthase [Planctomycetota bacterium]|nr:cardiolipin synthase [Planctomycetota bacterium]
MDLFTRPLSPGWWFAVLSTLNLIVSVGAIVHVLRQRKEPMAMLAWIFGLLLSILLLPVVGPLLYFSIGERRVARRGRKKRRRSAALLAALASSETAESPSALADIAAHPEVEESIRQLAYISAKLGSFPLAPGNQVQVLSTAQETYEKLLQALEEAQSHIHLEYYIFRPDETGKQFLDVLTRKASEGVEVRVLLDGIGSFLTRDSFFAPLVKAGGKLATFLPGIPWRSPWHINCRNHRKIVVVDAKVGFTGSQNIGDEYRGRLRRVGPWKDTHLRLEGPAVRELQEVFIEDWFYAAKENLTSLKYLRRHGGAGPTVVQIVPSGPDQESAILSHIYFAALALARRSIQISTPYFVPGPGLILALQHAAYRGIQVDILIPSKTDHRISLWAGRSFYPDLLRAGVRIHEFDLGMLHSKVAIIDDHWSLVGSANMDIRSFLLNFEVTASVFDANISKALQRDFWADVARSRPIVYSQRQPLLSSIIEGAARLCSPLL